MVRRDLEPLKQDWEQLLEENPVIKEKLRTIILERLLGEAEAKLAQQNGQVPHEQVVE